MSDAIELELSLTTSLVNSFFMPVVKNAISTHFESQNVEESVFGAQTFRCLEVHTGFAYFGHAMVDFGFVYGMAIPIESFKTLEMCFRVLFAMFLN